MEKEITITIPGVDLYLFMAVADWEAETGLKFSGYGGQFMLEVAADCFEDVIDIPERIAHGPTEVQTPSRGRLRIYGVSKSTADMFRWAARAHGCKVSDAYTLFARWVAEGWCRKNLDDYRAVNTCYETHESLIENLVYMSQFFKSRKKATKSESDACDEEGDTCD